MQTQIPVTAMAKLVLVLCFISKLAQAGNLELSTNQYGPFNQSYYGKFAVQSPAMISNGALQVTPDSAGNFTLQNRSGRVLLNQSIPFWDDRRNGGQVISFNTSFLINIFRLVNQSDVPGEGLAFIIAPDLDIPPSSHGQFLGLTNSTSDGNASNHLVAIEFDTFKQDFDTDDNHLGLDINGVHSVKNVSLSSLGITLCPEVAKNHTVWIEYDGGNKVIDVYIAQQDEAKPSQPALTSELDLRSIIKQNSYFGFAASTGTHFQLNCVLGWNLTFEVLDGNGGKSGPNIGLVVGIPLLVVLLVLLGFVGYWFHRKKNWARRSDSLILDSLQSLPGMPREFEFKDLKRATDNFSEKNKLGEGGFGVVYRGLLPKENIEVAVKKFSRDNIKGKDDFLAELTIINRLRHRHLVRLLGWCIKNGMLFLVYEYMPNKSLDNHLFCGEEMVVLGWNLRYKIITGVASALHYLHNEYDQKVVHRDLKASNIMLDSNFNARLGDFGLARALENEKTSYAEMEGVHGTLGYIAPECFHTGKATCESDIYGFGAVLLEVACGQRPATKNDGFNLLVDWVWSLHRDDRILEAVDPRLEKDYVVEEAKRILLLGLACSHPIASKRPKTQAIVQILSGSVQVPYVPPFKPSFVWPSAVPMGDDNSTDATPITSSQYTTSEYTTSPYGLVSGELDTR